MSARPILRLERRIDQPRWLGVALPFGNALLALALVGVLLIVTGHNPLSAYHKMIDAAFIKPGALTATLGNATPLLFTGLAAAIAFRVKVWNIGAEGQLYIGAIAATAAGVALGSSGRVVSLPAMVAAGAAGGAMWAAIPGLLRTYLSTSEILTSLMLNYLAGLLLYYLVFDSHSYWRDLSSPSAQVFPQGKPIAPSAYWPGLSTADLVVPLGLLLGLAAAVLLQILIRYTRFGFTLRVIADNPEAGRYAGMPTKRPILLVMLISGLLAGIAGASQVGDFSHLMDAKGLQQGSYGYTGIVVAALARYSPLGVIVTSIFLGALTNAGYALQGPGFPLGLVGTAEGIILFCVLGGEVIRRYRIRVRVDVRRSSSSSGSGEPPITGDLGGLHEGAT